jgi:AbrB family looped-hinge helix DNA binding protein
MKIGERGQVTIPKKLREKLGLKRVTEVEFQVVNNSTLFRKKPKKLALTRWKGRCKKCFQELGYARVDEFIEDVRGRRHSVSPHLPEHTIPEPL